MLVIVPNHVRDAIYSAIDAQIALVPDARKDRESLYYQLLAHFNEYGSIPEFTLAKTAAETSTFSDSYQDGFASCSGL